jgi:hypothetical protein
MDRAPRGGRGRGRGRGNGGRGFSGRSSCNKSYNSTGNIDVLKFGPFIANKPPPATYASVHEAIVLHFMKLKQNDVSTSLEDMEVVTLEKPVRVMSKMINEEDKVIEQEGFDIDYKGDMDEYRSRKRNSEDGMKQAYSIIFTDYCTKVMRGRIEEHPDFAKKIKNDPIELLKTVKHLCMHRDVHSIHK